jgi:hypothetical protein
LHGGQFLKQSNTLIQKGALSETSPFFNFKLFVVLNLVFRICLEFRISCLGFYYNNYIFYSHYNYYTGFPPEYNPAPNGAGRE